MTLKILFTSPNKLLAVRIWNFTKHGKLDSGIKNVDVLINGCSIYSGIVNRGSGNCEEEHCTTIFLAKTNLPNFKKGLYNHFVQPGNIYN